MNGQGSGDGSGEGGRPEGESLADVLASIRALVSAETDARAAVPGQGVGDAVLMLTEEMRIDNGLADGVRAPVARPAPILDEQGIRDLVSEIVREELQGELGDRIGRNLRKIIRREIAAVLEEQKRGE